MLVVTPKVPARGGGHHRAELKTGGKPQNSRAFERSRPARLLREGQDPHRDLTTVTGPLDGCPRGCGLGGRAWTRRAPRGGPPLTLGRLRTLTVLEDSRASPQLRVPQELPPPSLLAASLFRRGLGNTYKQTDTGKNSGD